MALDPRALGFLTELRKNLLFFFIQALCRDNMSMLQRITRAITTSRSFSTSRIALSTESTAATTNKPTGLYQFFENNEALPKQNWTGKKIASKVAQTIADSLV